MSDSYPYRYRFPFAKYPAVRIALLIAGGIITAYHLNDSFITLIAVIFISFCLLFIYAELVLKRSMNPIFYRLSLICYLAANFMFGMFWSTYKSVTKSHKPEHKIGEILAWEKIGVKGAIYNIRPTSSGKYLLDIAIDTTEINSKLWLNQYNLKSLLDPDKINMTPSLKPGNRIYFQATVYPLEEQRNPHEFNYKAFLATQGIYVQSGIDTIYTVSESRSDWSWVNFRQQVLELIDHNFSPNARPLAKALLIGYKNELDRDEKLAFSRVGLSHIMAVSGLHVGFIIAPFWLLIPWFWTLRYGKQIGLILLILLLTGYAGLTGFSASVSRAALTGGFITYGKLFHKIRDSINLTAASAIILLLINPDDLFNPGFQLSFSAVYIILLTMPTLSRLLPNRIRYRWYGSLLMVILVSMVVQAGLFPVLTYYFGEFSLIGPLANALVVPLLGFVVPFALALLPVTAVFPGLGTMLNYPNEQFLIGLGKFVRWGSEFEWSWIDVQHSSQVLFLIWIVAILTISALSIHEFRWKLIALFLLLMLLHSGSQLLEKMRPVPLSVTVFDVGHGDAILVQTPSGKNFLIDTGRWSPGYNSARYTIIPHLKAEGIQRLDAVFLSHPHADHIGGIVELLNEVPVDTIYNSGYRYHSDLYAEYLKIAGKKSVAVKSLSSGSSVYLDPAIAILIYGPAYDRYGDDPNEHSLVIELVYGDTQFLFTGDAGVEQENRLLKNYGPMLDTDFLKVGHHGSRTSSSVPFLSAITPDFAVVSLALRNRFGHPHPAAMKRINRQHTKLLFTSLERALLFSSDGKEIRRISW